MTVTCCVCGLKLNTNLDKYRCPKCKTEYEYANTIEPEPKHRKIKGYLGRQYNFKKLKRYIKSLTKVTIWKFRG